MKAGLTIEELATEVMRQKDAKADYIVNTSMLAMEHCGTELVLRVLDDSHIDRIEPLDIADTAHRQIGTRLGIPAKYYGKMLTEHPDLLVTNVNAWFEREPTERMYCNCFSQLFGTHRPAHIIITTLVYTQRKAHFRIFMSVNALSFVLTVIAPGAVLLRVCLLPYARQETRRVLYV